MFFVSVVNQKIVFFEAILHLNVLTKQSKGHKFIIRTITFSRNISLEKYAITVNPYF